MRTFFWLLLLPACSGLVACTQTTAKKLPVVEAQPGSAAPQPVSPTPPPLASNPLVPPTDDLGLREPDVFGKLPEDRDVRGSGTQAVPQKPVTDSNAGTVIARPPQ